MLHSKSRQNTSNTGKTLGKDASKTKPLAKIERAIFFAKHTLRNCRAGGLTLSGSNPLSRSEGQQSSTSTAHDALDKRRHASAARASRRWWPMTVVRATRARARPSTFLRRVDTRTRNVATMLLALPQSGLGLTRFRLSDLHEEASGMNMVVTVGTPDSARPPRTLLVASSRWALGIPLDGTKRAATSRQTRRNR